MDDRATSEVEDRNHSAECPIKVTALAPDDVGEREVNDRRPSNHQEDERTEFHSFGKGSGDQSWSDNGKHHLIDHECLLRDGRCVIEIGSRAHAFQKEEGEWIADEGVTFSKGHPIAKNKPKYADQGDEKKALHHGGEDILGSHQSSIKKGEAGGGHEEDKGGAEEHPSIVRVVDFCYNGHW